METVFDIQAIAELLPHRYPFLLIDRVVHLTPNEEIVALKNVTMNEPFFQGHFPDLPVMPGVLIVEAMAQTAATIVMLGLGEDAKDKVVYFMTITDVKFRRPVKPGDTLHLKVEVEQTRGAVSKFKGVAEVDGKVVSQARFSAMMADR